MKITRYSRYTGEPADAVDLEDLINQLSDYLLQSGFESPYSRWGEFDPERSMESLRQALLRALEDGDLLPKELLEELMNNPERRKELERLLDRLAERLTNEGFINQQPPMVTQPGQRAAPAPGATSRIACALKLRTRPSTSSASARCAI